MRDGPLSRPAGIHGLPLSFHRQLSRGEEGGGVLGRDPRADHRQRQAQAAEQEHDLAIERDLWLGTGAHEASIKRVPIRTNRSS